ncbi:orotate phosphoribosyltransferase [Fructilactobacillus lindneri]|uniref:Orotate phosphoribosyltransferase n=2 Tax=Fructilactobacillus lindneri TaxID=53444 RepID=A0A0R2JNS9_9LACO|nr:orotate phosphoribosyltransferase [Fructilactobacillus lindneri]ANZ57790.1 orotate phosphoribosyltransferase [Fructilactobacillus lindneri]ANZ59059.1 orotate phosphoribosyltransferase [Fructilactobacillus lindneri]KRN78769.1 Orotate phosphoribosyltransferase [Fructilactobacillus lindneri DSM 20690 = JCM 11027]POG98112.1 orotate phosphoribosyltransferase [Fructilactobacillus lindneri]POH01773.1 orotate phosphoribosyltransferase [Fructilactobacillus lindneri]
MNKIESQILHQLVENQIVKLNSKQNFQFASGIKSPIYTDLRLTVSYPKLRTMIAKALTELIKQKYPDATVIGGVATAGIPHATLVANNLELPMVYVRSKPKDHGTGKQIEGIINSTDKVVLIDDLISTGGSVIQAAQAVQKEGFNVAGIVSIFSYGFRDADNNFKQAELQFEPLLTYAKLIKELLDSDVINQEKYDYLSNWHQDPWAWK